MARMTVKDVADFFWNKKHIKTKEVDRMLTRIGLVVLNNTGSHIKYGHPKLPRPITFTHNKKEIDTGARKEIAEFLDDWGPLIECL